MSSEVDRVIETDVLIAGGSRGLAAIETDRGKVERVMWENVGIVKNQVSLEKALSEINNMRNTLLPTISTKTKSGRFNLEMLEAVERHMLVAAQAIVRSSLERKESRNRFHRSDYPAQDDKNWLRHIIITKSLEGITLESVEFAYLKPEVS